MLLSVLSSRRALAPASLVNSFSTRAAPKASDPPLLVNARLATATVARKSVTARRRGRQAGRKRFREPGYRYEFLDASATSTASVAAAPEPAGVSASDVGADQFGFAGSVPLPAAAAAGLIRQETAGGGGPVPLLPGSWAGCDETEAG